ncbi:neutral/alkaline non-lysosomal ceramidase N-terminal domain-containing protein [Spongiibacter sp.]|uniref:neutral/alkaline non-lysosomal ceramidase N-terminal domain-containing protein n=1 Tax=Spongiibacter sp. TaxID=2024860 RepID=UPI003564F83A
MPAIVSKALRPFAGVSIALLLSACGNGNSDSERGASAEQLASQCLANSPVHAYGEGLHAPSARTLPAPASVAGGAPAQLCNGNSDYHFGAAKADITGPAGGKVHMGNESTDNYSAGIHIRQYARSFVVHSPCNDKRVAMVLTDTGMMFESVRQAVLDAVAADSELSGLYGPDNIMLSASHTHSTPGGQAHYTAYNTFRLGHDPQTFAVTVDGIVRSLRQAQRNLAASPQTGKIRLNQGELLGANKSRAIPAYLENPAAERAQYVDINGNDITTNRLMTLLRLQRANGKEVGSINWFAVHPTSDALSEYGLGAVPISGDNKGYAAYLFERIKGRSDNEDFIAGFMQADEGDAFSQLWFDNDDMRALRDSALPANEPSPVTVANGSAQLNHALTLYSSAQDSLHGPIDYRFGYVKMDEVEVTDPVVLASLQHPAELDSAEKRTCTAAMGFSFPAAGHGAQPGEQSYFTPAGLSCRDPDYFASVQNDVLTLLSAKLPVESLSYAVGCNLSLLPGLNLSCQAEKPILFVFGPPLNVSANILPFQLFRIGNLAIIALPWEITTMAGRRIRDTVLSELKQDGVDYVVINGLANDYVSYLTTREEYALQMYEGASNQFGPWSLAAVQQEMRRLAVDMVQHTATDRGPTPPRTSATLTQVLPLNVLDSTPAGINFGDTLEDVATSYLPGDTARALFQASSPNHDLKTNSSFLFVERQLGNGEWQTIASDADPETSFVWHSDSEQPQFSPSPFSQAEILWRIPKDTQAGRYRLRFEASANSLGRLQSYQGLSSEFTVRGTPDRCP